ncbi:MAG: hypothetical protein ABII06_11395, partial [Pseudomonadota bacterium]
MKCPKCGYVSFDYNQVCPKCSKDISSEQEKLNFFPFRPNPPSLLGALTGEANESHVGLRAGTSASFGSMTPDDSMVLDDSALIGGVEDESQELEISLDSEDSGEFEAAEDLEIPGDEGLPDFELEGGETSEITFETGEISIEEADMRVSAGEEVQEEISLELGGSGREPMAETPAEEEDSLTLDLGDFSEEEETTGLEALDEIPIEEDSLILDLGDFSEEDAASGLETVAETPMEEDGA